MYYVKDSDWYLVYNSDGVLVLRTKDELSARRAMRDDKNKSIKRKAIALYWSEQKRAA